MSNRDSAMTPAVTALILAVVALLVAGWFAWIEREMGVGQEIRLAGLRQQISVLRGGVRQLRSGRITGSGTQPAAQDPAAGAGRGDADLEAKMRSILGRIHDLKERLARSPDQQIPELRFLKDRDWLEVAQNNGPLETEKDYRRALGDLRTRAVADLPIGKALAKFLQASQNQLPTEVTQLAAYFEPPLDATILERYEMRKSGTAPSDSMTSFETALVGEKLSALPDPIYDSQVLFTTNGIVTKYTFDTVAITAAFKAFSDAHDGQAPKTAEDALPFFQDPAAGAKFLEIAKAHHVFGEH